MAAAPARDAVNSQICRLRATLPFVSQSALGALLKAAQREQLPNASRDRVRKARDESVFEETTHGPIHRAMSVATSDGPVDLEVQSPQAMLTYFVASCPSFAARVEDAFRRRAPTPAAPWTIVLYTDEILPGNALAQTAHRKCWGWHWSILELGPAVLCNEDARRARKTRRCAEL